MDAPAPKLVADAGAAIGEAPLWTKGAVLWTAPVERLLLSLADDADSGRPALHSRPVARMVWSLAVLPDGSVAGTLDDAFCTLSAAGEIAAGPPAPLPPGCRLNDMAVDPRGGLWAGSMHMGVLATRGALFHSPSPDAPPRCVASGLGVPNGMKFAPDGKTLFVIDTLSRTLLAYPVGDDATLGEPVIKSDFLDLRGKPDGMTLAGDGSFWVAMWGAGAVVQLAPDGAFLRAIDIPAPHVSSLCFAGPDRLFVSTSRARLSPAVLEKFPGSGGLFEVLL